MAVMICRFGMCCGHLSRRRGIPSPMRSPLVFVSILSVVLASCSGSDAAPATTTTTTVADPVAALSAGVAAWVAGCEDLVLASTREILSFMADKTDEEVAEYVTNFGAWPEFEEGADGSLSVRLTGTAIEDCAPNMDGLWAALETPAAVVSRIGATRALDGMQTADYDGVRLSWTFGADPSSLWVLAEPAA